MANAAPTTEMGKKYKWDPKYRGKDGLSTEERLVKSRVKLLTSYPFFGQLALYLDLEEAPNMPTAATDGKKYFYNPDFIDSLEDAEVNWVTCHELLHPALGHLWRKGSRTHTRWNHAADYAIHCIMQEMAQKYPQDFKMPGFALYDAKYNEMSAEEIYEILEDEESLKAKGASQPNGGTMDSHEPWEDGQQGDSDSQRQQEEWKGRAVSAAQTAEQKSKGDMPAGLKRAIGQLNKPQKNWRQLLAEFVQFEIHDYAFSPPDRRLYGMGEYFGTDIILPDYTDETEVVRNLMFAIDTSGSIGTEELKVFLSEGVGLLNQFARQVTGKVLYADAEVAAVYDLDEIDRRPPAGGGGTSFVPVFKWIEEYEQKENVEVCGLVYLTDCMGDFPKREPNYPVLWVSILPLRQLQGSNWYPPFGQVTELKIGGHEN